MGVGYVYVMQGAFAPPWSKHAGDCFVVAKFYTSFGYDQILFRTLKKTRLDLSLPFAPQYGHCSGLQQAGDIYTYTVDARWHVLLTSYLQLMAFLDYLDPLTPVIADISQLCAEAGPVLGFQVAHSLVRRGAACCHSRMQVPESAALACVIWSSYHVQ